MAAHEARGDPRKLLDIGPHAVGTQGAVETDAQRGEMRDRVPKGLDRLAGEGAAAGVGDRGRDHHRQLDPPLIEELRDSEQARLEVERVESRFRHQEVDAPVVQGFDLLAVGGRQLVERDRPEAGIVHVGRERGGAAGGADAAGDEAGLFRFAGGEILGSPFRQFGRRPVDRVDLSLETVLGERDRLRVECVRLDDVGTGRKVLPVNVLDDVRPGEGQKVVAAFEVLRMLGKERPTEIGLLERMALDHGPHGAVENQDPRAQKLLKLRADGWRCQNGHSRIVFPPGAKYRTGIHGPSRTEPLRSMPRSASGTNCHIGNYVGIRPFDHGQFGVILQEL